MPEELVQAAANEAETAAPQTAQESTGTTQSAESTTTTETNSAKTDTRAVSNRINQIRAESDRKIKELTDQLARYRKLEDTAKELGFNGTSTDEIVYAMMAHKEGLTVDEIRKREEAKNQQVDSIVENDPRIAAANEIIQQSKFRADLESIKAAYPDLKAESVEDLGEDYIKMQPPSTEWQWPRRPRPKRRSRRPQGTLRAVQHRRRNFIPLRRWTTSRRRTI